MIGWQIGTAKFLDHVFSKKKRPGCLEFAGLVPTIWVFLQTEILYMVFTERLLVRVVFGRSIKVLGWHLGAEKYPEQVSP